MFVNGKKVFFLLRKNCLKLQKLLLCATNGASGMCLLATGGENGGSVSWGEEGIRTLLPLPSLRVFVKNASAYAQVQLPETWTCFPT